MTSTNIIDHLQEKLPEPKLRQLAEEKTDQQISVIIEPDIPLQKILYIKSPTDQGPGQYVPKKIAEETPAQQKSIERKVEKARDFLESLLGTTPSWLKSARAFVATATPEQIREIAQSSLIRTIRFNRHL